LSIWPDTTAQQKHTNHHFFCNQIPGHKQTDTSIDEVNELEFHDQYGVFRPAQRTVD